MELLLIWALMIWGSYKLAEKNGRDTGLAIVLGFFFGIFAVVGYLLAGPKNCYQSPQAGWYNDPSGSPNKRFWNGHTWTDHTS